MLARVVTFAIDGIDARRVDVEADIRPGLPAFTIVGLADTGVREARERVRAALANSGFEFPQKRITVNLAPADLRKIGPSFDLPLALAVLVAAGQLEQARLDSCAAVGELSLTGELRAIRGALAFAQGAAGSGLGRIIVPRARAREAALVSGLEVLAATGLREVVDVLRGTATAPPLPAPGETPRQEGPDLCDVRGQASPVPALEVAAAGGHNLHLHGPPGAGKTMLARRLATILPPLEPHEAIEVTRIHSVAGLHEQGELMMARPFRTPHYTVSAAGLVGGGNPPMPGEATLAHHGVLFLDELSEFPRASLESLRQPLEDGRVTIVRGQRSVEFPTRCMLVAASNPCPCGSGGPRCRCSAADLSRHRRKLSGPLLDRIDVSVAVQRPTATALRAQGCPPSAVVRARVVDARARQHHRYAGAASRATRTWPGAPSNGTPDRLPQRCAAGRAPRPPRTERTGPRPGAAHRPHPGRPGEKRRGQPRPRARRGRSAPGGRRDRRMPVTGAPTSAHRPGGCVVDACDACLRRRSLLAGLASWIDIEWRRRGSTSRVLALPDDALLSLGKSRRMAEEYRAFAPAHARQAIADAGLSAWCRCSAGYPDRVRELHDPPAVLHVAGFPEALHQPASVALVGARRATDYGLEVARALGRGLASSGVCVVSGLALGVDSAAHAGAVQGVARPVAVLAGGADVAYPSRMRSLYARVVARGCAVSELPPGFRAHRWCFVARNRVIAALSALTVVIEAAERSGSLTTADFAADLGRAVAAVPGPVTSPLSTGANALIAAGAGLIQDTRDVLDQLSLDGRPCIIEAPEPAGPALEPRLARVLEAVEAGHGTPGQMSAALGDPLAVLAALTELELRGLVRRRLGRSYMRTASGTPSPWHAPGEPLEDRPGPG